MCESASKQTINKTKSNPEITISVAMCTYNGARYLNDQLMSIAAQKKLPDELIICDDGSTDNTLEILKHFSETAPFEVMIIQNEKTLKSTKNFEKALSLCQGKYIFLCDQDDIWLPEKTQEMMKAFTKNVSLVFSNAFIVDENLQDKGFDLWTSVGFYETQKKQFNIQQYLQVLLKYNTITGAATAIKSQLLKEALPIPREMVHDEWLAYIAACFAEIAFVEKELLYYRQHSTQQIGTKLKSFSNDLEIARNRHIGLFTKELKGLVALKQRLIKLQENSAKIELKLKPKISLIDEKIDYLLCRAYIRNKNFQGKTLALKQLISGRYNRFGNGIKSLAKDLFLKP